MVFQSAEGMQESVPVLLLADLECTEGSHRRPCKESTAQGLSLNLEFHKSTGLAGQLSPGKYSFLFPQQWVYRHTTTCGFVIGYWNLNSDSVGIPITLQVETPP